MRDIKWFIFIVTICFGSFVLASAFVYADNSVPLDKTLTANPTSTYSSPIVTIEQFSGMRGIIVVDGNGTPTAYLNQSSESNNALANNWHSTHTVSFLNTGSVWRGEFNVPVLGRYAHLSVSGFSGATYNSVNWYGFNDSSSSESTITSAINNNITVGTVSTIVVPKNPYRSYYIAINTGGTNTCYLSLSSTATVGSGTPLLSSSTNYGYFESPYFLKIYKGDISAITSSGTTTVSVKEY